MHPAVRFVVSAFAALAGYFVAFWILGALLFRIGVPFDLTSLAALVCAIIAARYVWRRTESASRGLVSSIVIGAVVTGGIGFAGGFFGPMIFAPGANQGPMLGIFITGPLGFVLGAVGGGVYWFAQRDKGQA